MSDAIDQALAEKSARKAVLREEQQRRAHMMREEGLTLATIAVRLSVTEAVVRGLLGLKYVRKPKKRRTTRGRA